MQLENQQRTVAIAQKASRNQVIKEWSVTKNMADKLKEDQLELNFILGTVQARLRITTKIWPALQALAI